MKQIISVFIFISISLTLSAQVEDVEQLMTRRHIDCMDIYENVSYLIPEYYEKGEVDTLNALMQYWEENCPNGEALTRCKILFSIETGSFSESLYDERILWYIRSRANNTIYIGYGGYTWQDPEEDNLDIFTRDLAISLLGDQDHDNLESFFLRLYSGDTEGLIATLGGQEYWGSALQQYYLDEVNQYKMKVRAIADLYAGVWIPTGNNDILGVHPMIGFRAGIKFWRLSVTGALEFRFIKAANDYYVYEKDSLWQTNHYLGGYFALDLGLDLVDFGKNNIQLIAGIGYDGFDALDVEVDNSKDNITKTINSLNLNIGLGYRYYFDPYNCMGLDMKYNFVDYKNPNGTDLSGNTITIKLLYGFRGGRYNDDQLRELGALE